MIAALLTLSLAWLAPAKAEQAPERIVLAEISVEGLLPPEASRARALVHLAPGDGVLRADLERITQRLREAGFPMEHYRIGLAPSDDMPEPGPVRARLMIDFRPPPLLGRVRVLSLLPGSDAPYVRELTLQRGEVYDRNRVSSQSLTLELVANDQGFPNARAVPRLDNRTSGTVGLTFILEPGDPPVLDHLEVDGAGWIQPIFLRGALKNLSEHPIEDDVTTLTAGTLGRIEALSRQFFFEQGWLEARTELHDARVESGGDDPPRVRVTLQVERGRRFRVGAVGLEGIDRMTRRPFDRLADRLEGRRFSRERYKDFEQELHELAAHQGFFAPQVEVVSHLRPEPAHVDLIAHIDEGTTSTLDAIRIVHRPYPKPRAGWVRAVRDRVTPRIEEEVIRRQIMGEVGDPLTWGLVEQTDLNLHAMGIFDQIRVESAPTTDPRRRELLIDVRDKLTAAMNFTAGWSDAAGAMGGVEFIERNMFGVGDQLSFGFSASELYFNGHVSYFNRNWAPGDRLLGRRRAPSLTTTAYYLDAFFNEYTEQHRGGAVALGYRLLSLPQWRNQWRLRTEYVGYEIRRDPEDYEESFENYFATTLLYQIGRDTRRHGDWSREGANFATALEVGSAAGFLLKSTTRLDHYQPIYKALGWVGRAQLGIMPHKADRVGLADRFQAGGVDDLRGFDVRGIGPVDPLVDDLRVGGATRLMLQNELRLRLHENFMTLAFFDAGSLSASPASFNAWRLSAGAGARLKIPDMNSELFLYWAEEIVSTDTDEGMVFHFGVRFAF